MFIYCLIVLYYLVLIIENSTLMIDHSQPWSTLLVNWTILQDEKNNSRTSRVMKFNEKVVNIMRPGSMTNKREVSETDLYLLGMYKKILIIFY